MLVIRLINKSAILTVLKLLIAKILYKYKKTFNIIG
jgi:hypothetical protein